MFQIAVSKQHPVNDKRLLERISAMSTHGRMELASVPIRSMFDVPDFIAADFKQQSISKKDVVAVQFSKHELRAVWHASCKIFPVKLQHIRQLMPGMKLP